jgi:hypothetical protein
LGEHALATLPIGEMGKEKPAEGAGEISAAKTPNASMTRVYPTTLALPSGRKHRRGAARAGRNKNEVEVLETPPRAATTVVRIGPARRRSRDRLEGAVALAVTHAGALDLLAVHLDEAAALRTVPVNSTCSPSGATTT